MKKTILLMLALLFLLPGVLAINLTIEKQNSNEVIIVDIYEPAILNLNVTNNGASDSFLFYTFFGMGLEPATRIQINKDETKEIQLKIYPRQDSNLRGFSTFSYFVQGTDSSETSEKVVINLLDLKDVFEIGSEEVDPDSSTIGIYIHNKMNIDFKDLEVDFKSSFFELLEKMDLSANEKKTFTIGIDKEDFDELTAGFYTMTAKIQYKDIQAETEGKINFLEKDILTTAKKEYGIIINTRIIEKKNEGNVIVNTQTILKKNIFSRLFTNFSPEPTKVERQQGTIYYTWDQIINPGETSEIIVRTNWIIPLLIIILIIAILLLTKRYLRTNLVLRKKISFVKAKGGEFALKVTIIVNARKYLEKVNIIERLPPLVKIYERFFGEQPSRIDKNKRRLEWNFEKLEEGERRVITYIVYSKVGILGRFALPSTTGLFEREGKIKEVNSNKAYFMAEAIKRRPEN